MSNQILIIELNISADDYLRYYSGQIKSVNATAMDGRRVQFPASILQKVVTHMGVHGRFAIEFDSAGRFQSIHRV